MSTAAVIVLIGLPVAAIGALLWWTLFAPHDPTDHVDLYPPEPDEPPRPRVYDQIADDDPALPDWTTRWH